MSHPQLGMVPKRPRAAGFAVVAATTAWILLGAAAPAEAQSGVSGQELKKICSSEISADLGLCHGFFRGLSDTHSIYAAMQKGLGLYCLPAGATQEQFEHVALNWMDEHPDELERPAALLVLQALNDRFPCNNDGAGGENAPGGAPPATSGEGG